MSSQFPHKVARTHSTDRPATVLKRQQSSKQPKDIMGALKKLKQQRSLTHTFRLAPCEDTLDRAG